VFTLSVSSMRKTVATDSVTCTWYLWHKGDYDNMARVLDSINWSAVLCDHPSAERMWNVFIDILWSAITCVLITYCIPVSMAFVDENPQPRTALNVSMTGL